MNTAKMSTVTIENKTYTDNEFLSIFQPLRDNQGCIKQFYRGVTRELDEQIENAKTENRLWSLISSGDDEEIATGERHVNCMYLIITEVAHEGKDVHVEWYVHEEEEEEEE